MRNSNPDQFGGHILKQKHIGPRGVRGKALTMHSERNDL